MEATTATLIVAALGIGGTLGAPILTQRMSRSWQREQWIRDEAVKEYRELLNALSESYKGELTGYNIPYDPLSGDVPPSIQVQGKISQVVRSRIIIAAQVYNLQVELRWVEALRQYHRDGDVGTLAATYTELQIAIANAVVRGVNGTRRKRRKAPRPGEQ